MCHRRFWARLKSLLIISVGARKRRADADFWARKRCADYPKQPNERGKGAPTAKHGRGKYAQIKRRVTNGFRVKKVPGTRFLERRYLREACAPRAGTARPNFGKEVNWTMYAFARAVRAHFLHFPRFELKVKSCGIENAEKRSNFRTRSRTPPRASARARRAKSKKRQVPRLHSATFATRNG